MKALLHEIVRSLENSDVVKDVAVTEKDGKIQLDVVTDEENILSLEDIVIHMKAKPAEQRDLQEGADYFDDEKLSYSNEEQLVMAKDSEL